jgi:hypothetical protein
MHFFLTGNEPTHKTEERFFATKQAWGKKDNSRFTQRRGFIVSSGEEITIKLNENGPISKRFG